MPEETRTTHRHSTPGHRLAHFFGHLLHRLPGALIVASLVAIGHLQLHLLDAVDSYALLAIGNLGTIDTPTDRLLTPRVAVVLIDQTTHERQYKDRSPLDRCELEKDLKGIYEGRTPPRLVVIDLDLSPSPRLRESGPALPMVPTSQANGSADRNIEADCEERLYRLFERPPGLTRTVLKDPADVIDPYARLETLKWKERMARAMVGFGDARLPVHFGLVTKLECRPDGLAAMAFQQYSPTQTTTCVSDEHASQRFLIAPRQYLHGLRTSTVANLPSRNPWIRDLPEVKFGELAHELPVVFFGAGSDEGDSYLTPVGTRYGVEVHAAAYLSLVEPASGFNRFLGFLLELLLALAFGLFIAWGWRSYYRLHFSHRHLAAYLAVLLSLAFMFLVVLAAALSLFLLGNSDYWLSPIPIAIGMFIESYFAGAVPR